jgi:hypothetical protein
MELALLQALILWLLKRVLMLPLPVPLLLLLPLPPLKTWTAQILVV